MPVSGQPTATTYQVGDEVYYIENNVPALGEVSKTLTEITDVDSNNTAEVTTRYQLVDKGTVLYSEDKLFATANDLKTYLQDLIDAL